MATHKELDVWKQSITLVTDIYKLTGNFPQSEHFGLVAQMRRAAVSVPNNIAEGASRDSSKEYVRFLNISIGSIAELETQIIISNNLEYLDELKILDDVELIKSKLYKLRNYLKSKV